MGGEEMAVEIVDYTDEYASAFARLNYEWIERYFRVERHDREILDDPRKYVLKPGGQIFVALAHDTQAGTVALIPAGEGAFELTKMAVSPQFQGLGIGKKLMERCIDYAQSHDARLIFLESHSSLTPALNLYRKYGFLDAPVDPNSEYARADVRMELKIDPA
jgi:ribosomal protein S18 acetylase RimI-like enzyme